MLSGEREEDITNCTDPNCIICYPLCDEECCGSEDEECIQEEFKEVDDARRAREYSSEWRIY